MTGDDLRDALQAAVRTLDDQINHSADEALKARLVRRRDQIQDQIDDSIDRDFAASGPGLDRELALDALRKAAAELDSAARSQAGIKGAIGVADRIVTIAARFLSS